MLSESFENRYFWLVNPLSGRINYTYTQIPKFSLLFKKLTNNNKYYSN